VIAEQIDFRFHSPPCRARLFFQPLSRTSSRRVRSAAFVLPHDVLFAEARRDDLTVREGVPHTSI
jgi:hypothetical protein